MYLSIWCLTPGRDREASKCLPGIRFLVQEYFEWTITFKKSQPPEVETKIQFQNEEAAFPLNNAPDFLSSLTASLLHSGLAPEYLMGVGGG